jgi:DNA-binding LacI/PurR family transcriptional regulator
MLALGAVIEAQARGIPVPEGVAVVGYGDLNFAADTIPPLTTVSVDGPAIGRLARCIIDRAQGRSVAGTGSRRRILDRRARKRLKPLARYSNTLDVLKW